MEGKFTSLGHRFFCGESPRIIFCNPTFVLYLGPRSALTHLGFGFIALLSFWHFLTILVIFKPLYLIHSKKDVKYNRRSACNSGFYFLSSLLTTDIYGLFKEHKGRIVKVKHVNTNIPESALLNEHLLLNSTWGTDREGKVKTWNWEKGERFLFSVVALSVGYFFFLVCLHCAFYNLSEMNLLSFQNYLSTFWISVFYIHLLYIISDLL